MREMTSTHDQHLLNDVMLQTAPSVFATEAHHETSDKYGFIPTIQVVDALRSHGWMPVDATQKNVRTLDKRDFTKHLVRFRRLGNDIVVGDSVVELLLTNSHDRSSSFNLHAGIFRMACANGIVIADSTFQKVSVRHNRYAAERVVEGSYSVIEEVPAITSQVEAMQNIQLSPEERNIFANTALDFMLPTVKEGVSMLTSQQHMVGQLLTAKRVADTGHDLWSTYNVIQEKALRGGLKTVKVNLQGEVRRSTAREVKSIDKNIKLNKALWDMAIKMKELKSVA